MSFVTRIPLLLLLAAAPAQAQTVSLANAIAQPTATVTGPGWTGRPAGAHDGVDCAGGVLLAGTASRTMTALVTRAHAGETSFWWYRTTGTATVTFSINGVTKAIYTGTGWQKQTVATLPGDQTLEWTISRPDTSDPGGTILVDELELSSAPAVAPGITALPATVTRRRLLENYLNLNQPVGWQPWTHVITADPPPDSWSVTGLPVGLTTQAGGIFAVFGQHTGTAPARGVYPVNLHATNAAGTGTSVWQLTVTDPPFVPAQTVTASRAALLQTSPSNPWRRRVAVEGLWTSITITGLPTGIIQDPAVPDTLLAQHMGTAPAVGTHAITVTATGPDGSTSPVILLSVAEQPPVLNADAPWMITATQLLGRPPLRPASAWPIIVTVTDGADVSAWNATGLPAGLRWTGSARQLVIDRTPGAPLPMLHEMPAGSPWPLRISATNADGTTLV